MSTGVFLTASLITRGMAFDRLRGVFFSPTKVHPENASGIELADALLERILVHSEPKTAEVVRKASQRREFGLRELVSLLLVTPDFFQY